MKTRTLMVLTACMIFAAAARADEIDRTTILTAFDRGGKVMWAILAVSVAACCFATERIIALRRGAQIPKRLLANLREAMVGGGVAAGLKVVEGNKSAMGRVMFALLSRSGGTRRELETALDDEAARVLFDLRKNLRAVGAAAMIAPQLGLLGTVFGLIAAFRTAAELGMDDPRNFAAGIYEALYTTAFGLVVAIPLLMIYHWLRTKADSIMRDAEERGLAFISAASSRAEMARRGTGREEFCGDDGPFGESAVVDDGPRADAEETSVQDA